jgi:hypothetical protein
MAEPRKSRVIGEVASYHAGRHLGVSQLNRHVTDGEVRVASLIVEGLRCRGPWLFGQMRAQRPAETVGFEGADGFESLSVRNAPACSVRALWNFRTYPRFNRAHCVDPGNDPELQMPLFRDSRDSPELPG